MELKPYQQHAMKDLDSYIGYLNRDNNLFTAWKHFWAEKDIRIGFGGVPAYNNSITGVPHVCLKVPTGGGKTFMACAAVRRMFEKLPISLEKVVVWLVPSNAILEQTVRTLSDVNHPYRRRLDADFGGRVEVYTKEMLLNGQNFSPDTVREMLTVCVLSYDSLRVDSKKKDVRKVYQENGNLFRFAEYFKNTDVLMADTPDTALIQVLRSLSPVVIVDESHNAGSKLSEEMLNNLNPSFVLDLTATPRKNSNILTYVDARELKRENMVKLPVIVYNRNNHQTVVQDAVHLQNSLEQQARAEEAEGGQYIRPIVLFQAQPKTSKDSETFEKVKETLVKWGIPEEQIAIKTSKVDELKGENLLSPTCKIRYIITVNALKEGWDCPFAYILASLANKTSSVDVEQILGRILRQPYARQHKAALLNASYVLTCSNDFRTTLDSIVSGLNKAGFSRKDYVVGQDEPELPVADAQNAAGGEQIEINNTPATASWADSFGEAADNAPDFHLDVQDTEPAREPSTPPVVSAMEQAAEAQVEQYNQEAEASQDNGFIGGELGDMLKQYAIQPQFRDEIKELKIPQFFVRKSPSLFSADDFGMLTRENLTEGFSLNEQDTSISFELATGDMYQVDLQEQGEAIPKYKVTSKEESAYIRERLASLPTDRKIKEGTSYLCKELDKSNDMILPEIRDYVHRIVKNMTEDELAAMETSIPTYARKIREKIEMLKAKYREAKFKQGLDSGKIVCRPSYSFPSVITPSSEVDSIPSSLYEAEANINEFEFNVISRVASMDNVRWWHRVIERKGFVLNGFINHYPDFIIMTKSGVLVLLETKGDHLRNPESEAKLRLGRRWQSEAGKGYRYFMVFKDRQLDEDGAYTLDGFVEVMREL